MLFVVGAALELEFWEGGKATVDGAGGSCVGFSSILESTPEGAGEASCSVAALASSCSGGFCDTSVTATVCGGLGSGGGVNSVRYPSAHTHFATACRASSVVPHSAEERKATRAASAFVRYV